MDVNKMLSHIHLIINLYLINEDGEEKYIWLQGQCNRIFCLHYKTSFCTDSTLWYGSLEKTPITLSTLQLRHNDCDCVSITGDSIVFWTVYSHQWKHQSSASLAFVRWPVNFPHCGPVTRKMFPFDDVIMNLGIQPMLTQIYVAIWCH